MIGISSRQLAYELDRWQNSADPDDYCTACDELNENCRCNDFDCVICRKFESECECVCKVCDELIEQCTCVKANRMEAA